MPQSLQQICRATYVFEYMEISAGHLIWGICYVLVLLGLSAYGLQRYSILYLYLRHRKDRIEPARKFEKLPVITVQLPVYNEIHVAGRLLDAVAALDYPRHLLEVQVLDDSTDATTELLREKVLELQKTGLDVQFLHRQHREGFKAGALEYGLLQSRGEFLLILDADFVPSPDLLLSTVHHFTDENVGMIQTRWGHLNRDASLLTKVQSILLDGHLLLEQTARSRSGRFFNFNGTAGLWRKEAIRDAGGWEHDTLTEDLDLSYRAQLAGWRFVFLKEVVTPAELPAEMNAFKSQQHRWTKGSIQTCKKVLPRIWKAKLPWHIKLEATAHLTANFVYLLLGVLCLLLHPSVGSPMQGFVHSIVLALPIFGAATLSSLIFYTFTLRELYPATWIREMVILPALLAVGIGLSINNSRAVLEALANYKTAFNRTPKYGFIGKAAARRYCSTGSVFIAVELAFATLFSWFVLVAVMNAQWLSLPFLVLFLSGFLFVALSSLGILLPARQSMPKVEPEFITT